MAVRVGRSLKEPFDVSTRLGGKRHGIPDLPAPECSVVHWRFRLLGPLSYG